MASGKAEVSIARSPDDVWKLLREFGGLEQWMPGIEKCAVDGDVRTLDTMGIQIEETLRGRDDANRTISYSVTKSPMGNLASHLATISVEPEGEGSHVTYTVEVEPGELLPLFHGVYESAVVEIKKKLEA
jgi:carbon monoxide dehydrogenase subunit G